VLDYVLPEDWSLVCRASPQRLKWARLRRLTTQAYSQGVALSLPDLAHLLGLSVDAVEATIKKHQDVVLPTRGRVADMGSTLTHAEKVISLYMDGYTETEIKRRTGHSYDSIERYLWDFARVVYLAEREMPLPAIRQALGMSRRVVTRYLELHRRFSHPDYAFRMARVRRMAEAGGPGKGPNTSDWR
jgi:biotin operon repressor